MVQVDIMHPVPRIGRGLELSKLILSPRTWFNLAFFPTMDVLLYDAALQRRISKSSAASA
jgi:hypothetical protein